MVNRLEGMSMKQIREWITEQDALYEIEFAKRQKAKQENQNAVRDNSEGK